MSKGRAYSLGGKLMSAGASILLIVLPKYIPQEWDIVIIIASSIGILSGLGLWAYGSKIERAEDKNILEDIKDNLIKINSSEKVLATTKTRKGYPKSIGMQLHTRFAAIFGTDAKAWANDFINRINREQGLDVLIDFASKIADIVDDMKLGLKEDLAIDKSYTDLKIEINQKRLKLHLNKNKKAITQTNIDRIYTFSYGMNSSIIARHILSVIPRNQQNPYVVQLLVNLQGIEAQTEKVLNQMLEKLILFG